MEVKQLFWNCIIISYIFWLSACSIKQATSVLNDISRDTYENTMKKQHLKNIGDPNYEEPPTYDQYQKDRKGMSSNL